MSSADFHSAVSRICNPPAVRNTDLPENCNALPNAIRRYGRLQICATSLFPGCGLRGRGRGFRRANDGENGLGFWTSLYGVGLIRVRALCGHGEGEGVIYEDGAVVLVADFGGHVPFAAEIGGHFLGDVFERAVGFNNGFGGGAKIEVQEAVRLSDVTNDVRLLLHHHNDHFGFVPALGEDVGGELRKVIAVAAFAFEKGFGLLYLVAEFISEVGEVPDEAVRREILLSLQVINQIGAGDRGDCEEGANEMPRGSKSVAGFGHVRSRWLPH